MQVVCEVGEQDGNIGHLLGQGIAVRGGQGGQVGILCPLGVLHQLGGFEGNARGERPQVVELLPVALLTEGQQFIAQLVADHGWGVLRRGMNGWHTALLFCQPRRDDGKILDEVSDRGATKDGGK